MGGTQPESMLGAGLIWALIAKAKAMKPVIGEVIFVDTDAGIDALGRGSYAAPLKTINYANTNNVVAYRNDLIIAWGSLGGGFDENIFADGIRVNKAGVVIAGVNHVVVDNTNVGASHVFNVSAPQCWIFGFAVVPTAPIIGLQSSVAGTMIGDPEYPMLFDGCSVDVRMTATAIGDYAHDNRHMNSLIGYDVLGTMNEIHNNRMESVGGPGTIAINFSAATALRNYAKDNVALDYNVGLNAVALAVKNVCAKNNLQCTTNVVDANSPRQNAWIENGSGGLIKHTNTTAQDLKAIYDSASASGGGGGGESPGGEKVGTLWFVDGNAGDDVNGDGSFGNPWRTIGFAMGSVVDDRNDTIVTWESAGLGIDVNAAPTGVTCNKRSMSVLGVDYPIISNTNVGATSIFLITAIKVAVVGFSMVVDAGGGASYGCDVRAQDFELESSLVTLAGGALGGILFVGATRPIITDTKFYGGNGTALAFTAGSEDGRVENCWIYGIPTGISFAGASIRNLIKKNSFVNCATSWLTVAAACNGNIVEKNGVMGCGAHVLGSETFMLGNELDKVDLTHPITVAVGVLETMIADFSPVRSGELEVQFDVATLIANEAALNKMATFRLKQKIDNVNYALIDQMSFVAGSNLLHPKLRGYVEGGMSNVLITVQMDQVVGAQRNIPTKIQQEG